MHRRCSVPVPALNRRNPAESLSYLRRESLKKPPIIGVYTMGIIRYTKGETQVTARA
jgi:hypothetical protein